MDYAARKNVCMGMTRKTVNIDSAVAIAFGDWAATMGTTQERAMEALFVHAVSHLQEDGLWRLLAEARAWKAHSCDVAAGMASGPTQPPPADAVTEAMANHIRKRAAASHDPAAPPAERPRRRKDSA